MHGTAPALSDIILDIFKPAPDSRGEPTRQEITESRKKFTQGLIGLGGGEVVLSGIAGMPRTWSSIKGVRSYLVVSRVKGYSLFRMDCSRKDSFVCMLRRKCFLRDAVRVSPAALSGIAISRNRRQILIADRSKNRLLVFRWNSCFDVPYLGSIALPSSLNRVRNIMIDNDDSLWLSTEFPDNYLNASVYKWLARDWGL